MATFIRKRARELTIALLMAGSGSLMFTRLCNNNDAVISDVTAEQQAIIKAELGVPAE